MQRKLHRYFTGNVEMKMNQLTDNGPEKRKRVTKNILK